jgi:hypothetical protein
MTSLSISAPVTTFRLGRFSTGRSMAFDAFQRTPFFWFTSKWPMPKLSPRFVVGLERDAGLLRSLRVAVEDVPVQALFLDAPFAPGRRAWRRRRPSSLRCV